MTKISYKRDNSRFPMLIVSVSLFVAITLLVSFVSFVGAQPEPMVRQFIGKVKSGFRPTSQQPQAKSSTPPATMRNRKLAISVLVGFLPEAARPTEAMHSLTMTSMIR